MAVLVRSWPHPLCSVDLSKQVYYLSPLSSPQSFAAAIDSGSTTYCYSTTPSPPLLPSLLPPLLPSLPSFLIPCTRCTNSILPLPFPHSLATRSHRRFSCFFWSDSTLIDINPQDLVCLFYKVKEFNTLALNQYVLVDNNNVYVT